MIPVLLVAVNLFSACYSLYHKKPFLQYLHAQDGFLFFLRATGHNGSKGGDLFICGPVSASL
ncbi:hypothetical protein HAP94_14460 [Acidithiobacillus ferrivorans]|nr:hypothetical protein [Acidithiobacillus ferrivorans]